MADSLAPPLAALALAAGAGTRLRPLTFLRPKPLCPVGDQALLDHALDAIAQAVPDAVDVAVNTSYMADSVEGHLRSGGRDVRISHEPEPLGTAGAIGALRSWLDGRGVLVVNADTYHRADLGAFVGGWDGGRVRVLTPTPGEFGARSGVVASLLPWSIARDVPAAPAGLWELVWRDVVGTDRLETVHESGPVIDCATPADYLRANMVWSGGESVIGAGAVVRGEVVRSVVWPGSEVAAGERLVDAIRAEDRTVLVR